MPDDNPETREVQQQHPPSESALAKTERRFLRLTFWQTVLSVAGVFVAVVALYAALTESAAVRQQTAAAVWPFVQFSTADSDSGGSAEFAISFTNVGVGPAKMRAMRLLIDGKPARDWSSAIAGVGGQVTEGASRDFIRGRVLSPGESVVAFRTTDSDLARRLQATVVNPDSSIAFCYCSIFDECWLADSQRDLQHPEAVEECPDFGASAFSN